MNLLVVILGQINRFGLLPRLLRAGGSFQTLLSLAVVLQLVPFRLRVWGACEICGHDSLRAAGTAGHMFFAGSAAC